MLVPCEVVLVALLNLGNGPKEEFHLFLVSKLVLKVYDAIGIPSDEDRASKWWPWQQLSANNAQYNLH